MEKETLTVQFVPDLGESFEEITAEIGGPEWTKGIPVTSEDYERWSAANEAYKRDLVKRIVGK